MSAVLDDQPRPAPLRSGLAYLLMLAVTVGLFLLPPAWGEGLPASLTPSVAANKPTSGGELLPKVLLALATVVVAGQVAAWAFRYVGQPPVVGEVVAGILLGPSLLGRVAPG